MVKGNFPKKRKSVIYHGKKIVREKFFRPFFRTHFPLSFCQKLEKTNEAILHKVQKTLFLGGFWPKFAQKNFFSENRAPSHFGHCHFASLCQKSAKNNEPTSRKAGNWKMVKGNFPKKRKSVIHDEKKFSGKNCFGHFLEHIALYLSAKN